MAIKIEVSITTLVTYCSSLPLSLKNAILAKTRACSSVDRASGSGPEGRGFESLHARFGNW